MRTIAGNVTIINSWWSENGSERRKMIRSL